MHIIFMCICACFVYGLRSVDLSMSAENLGDGDKKRKKPHVFACGAIRDTRVDCFEFSHDSSNSVTLCGSDDVSHHLLPTPTVFPPEALLHTPCASANAVFPSLLLPADPFHEVPKLCFSRLSCVRTGPANVVRPISPLSLDSERDQKNRRRRDNYAAMPIENKRKLLELRSKRRLCLSHPKSSTLHGVSSELETIQSLSPSLVNVCSSSGALDNLSSPSSHVATTPISVVSNVQPIVGVMHSTTSNSVRVECSKRPREKDIVMPLEKKKKWVEARRHGSLPSVVARHQAVLLPSFNSHIAEQNTFSLGRCSLGSGCTSALPSRSDAAGPDQPMPSLCVKTHLMNSFSLCHTSAWMLPLVPRCNFCDAVRLFREPPGFCCRKGQVSIPEPRMPASLWALYTEDTSLAREFRRRARSYNNTSAFTSLGMKSDPNLTWANRGVYTLKVTGMVYHFIQDLIPSHGTGSHLQLYFYGTENELNNRLAQSGDLQPHIIEIIMELMRLNPYANFFRSLRSLENVRECKIVLRADPNLDERVYNLPVVDHVAAIWNEDTIGSENQQRDIRVYADAGQSYSVKYFYGCYDPLQYPLLFPYGEPGWHLGIQRLTHPSSNQSFIDFENSLRQQTIYASNASSAEELLHFEEQVLQRNTSRRNNVTALDFYCFRLQMRNHNMPSILRCGRLSQQYHIDMYIKIETSRLDYLRLQQQQNEARMESYQGIVDSIEIFSTSNGRSVGRRVVLPASFIGGPRDMRRRYMNAMALVQKYGKPDIFLTMTCNPAWPEIKDGLLPGEEAQNRSDLAARVFRARLEEMKDELITKRIFGKVAAYIYVVEFQKRGLPHAHWLLIMKREHKIVSPEAYDSFVCAELPDKTKYPHLHACVVRHMMHGPCGDLNPGNVCMRDGACKNHYPKDFCEVTKHHENSYPCYRRRNDSQGLMVRGCYLDNRWVVPYNPFLLSKFDCHINVEVCSDIKLVKYLYKYVYKGIDRVAYHIVEENMAHDVDEIQDFQFARWISAPESMWRIYGFSLNEMYPAVYALQVHLPNQQFIRFNPRRQLEDIVSDPLASKTMLTEFFWMNQHDPDAIRLNLLYRDFPAYFVWNSNLKRWTLRKQRPIVGRLVTSNPSEGERYYLRILLAHVRAPTSYEYLKTVGDSVYDTFRQAALERGLLESDNDIKICLREAATYQMAYSFRRLFATVLIYNSPADPKALWEEFQSSLAEDFSKECRLGQHEVIERTLKSIDVFLQSMGRSIDEFCLVNHQVGYSVAEKLARDIEQERSIIVSEQDLISVDKLNIEQSAAYQAIMQSVEGPEKRIFFVDGPGGTGKTFLYRALLASIRSKGYIALAVATSGVAASLLPGGRTAHSRFKLPIDLDEGAGSTITKQSVSARLILDARMIIWDEASMANRLAVEALDRLLRDVTGLSQIFGNKTVVFGGDFRQTIPIVVGGSREQTIDASLVKSAFWQAIHKIHLHENMRAREDPAFMDFLLRVGDGLEPYIFDENIKIPSCLCIPFIETETSLSSLISSVFPSFQEFLDQPYNVINRAILTPKNDCVAEINEMLIDKFPGNMAEYVGFDATVDTLQQGQYADFLNSVDVSSLPPHILRLKVNSPVMLLRNIDPAGGLSNGTRLICRHLGKKIIGAEIACGDLKGKYVFIPRIPLEPGDKLKCPISFKRHQFPLRLCFAMTINKAQGQTLDRVGIYLPQPVFSHGQLYVALSRARSSDSIKVLIRPPILDVHPVEYTKNVVYKDMLRLAMPQQ